MRIGIHNGIWIFLPKGSIIGGVIGIDIVRYDVYGRDVLIANKMESGGKEGMVCVSETTRNLLELHYPNQY
jgi:class 3 adenylate cyclase